MYVQEGYIVDGVRSRWLGAEARDEVAILRDAGHVFNKHIADNTDLFSRIEQAASFVSDTEWLCKTWRLVSLRKVTAREKTEGAKIDRAAQSAKLMRQQADARAAPIQFCDMNEPVPSQSARKTLMLLKTASWKCPAPRQSIPIPWCEE